MRRKLLSVIRKVEIGNKVPGNTGFLTGLTKNYVWNQHKKLNYLLGDVDRFFGSQKSLGIYYKQKLLESVENNNDTI